MMAVSAMPAMAAVFPEQPTKGKPTAAGDITNDPPGKGPNGTGSVGAAAFLEEPNCTGAEVFVFGRAGGDGRGGHCQ
jgi:hypothetical protein